MKKAIKPIIYSAIVLIVLYLGYFYANDAGLFNYEFDATTIVVVSLLSLAFFNIAIVAGLSFLSLSIGKNK